MSKKDTTWKNHKYVKKVRTKTGRWRYIYDPNPGNDTVADYDLDQALYDIQSMPDGKEKEAAMTDWYKKKQFIESDVGVGMGSMGYSDPYIEHYGVLGMRWGVRRGRADQALGKTVKQLGRWEKKSAKAQAKISARAESKAAKLDRKAAKLSYKASKQERKIGKIKRKAGRAFLPMSVKKAQRKIWKAEARRDNLNAKSGKLSYKSSKIKDKQAKARASYEKYQRKSAKLANAAIKEFSNVSVKDLNRENYAALEKYAAKYAS